MKNWIIRAKVIGLGVIFSLVLLEGLVRLGGFIFLSSQEYRNKKALKDKETYRILCLGESVTATGGKNSYPCQLERILNKRNLGMKFSVINKGVVAMDSVVVADNLEDNLDKYNPDMVITMIGCNNGRERLPYGNVSFDRKRYFKFWELAQFIFYNIVSKGKQDCFQKVVKEERNDNNRNCLKEKELDLFKKKHSIPENNLSENDLVALGDFYMQVKQYGEAEKIYKKTIEINSECSDAYVKLGNIYYRWGNYHEAEKCNKKAIELNPRNDWAYFQLGQTYTGQKGQKNRAMNMMKKAIKINPRNDWAYLNLALRYNGEGKWEEAENMFRKVIEINPQNEGVYYDFGSLYIRRGLYGKAKDIFIKAMEVFPDDDRIYGALALCYRRLGEYELAKNYEEKANKIRFSGYNPITRDSYQKIKEVVKRRGVKLVCMQYPMRKVSLLKAIVGLSEGVVFVDNERVFKKAVEREGYEVYFNDMFAGDFGHCTSKGYRLLAENVANVLEAKKNN